MTCVEWGVKLYSLTRRGIDVSDFSSSLFDFSSNSNTAAFMSTCAWSFIVFSVGIEPLLQATPEQRNLMLSLAAGKSYCGICLVLGLYTVIIVFVGAKNPTGCIFFHGINWLVDGKKILSK